MRAETAIKCAQKAYPGTKWARFVDGYNVVDEDRDCSFRLSSLEDQMALQIALEKEGWHFGWRNYEPVELFEAWKGFYGFQNGVLFAGTKAELLSKCVEAGQ